MSETKPLARPCAGCPWRTSNQGTKHPGGFYTAANLRRMWNGIRRGEAAQSCHMTDPSHPDHLAAGCSPNAKTRECPASVILVLRELRRCAPDGDLTPEAIKRYACDRKGGLTREGFRFWVVGRLVYGGVPFVGGAKLPEVDEDEPGIGLPEALAGER